MPSRMPEDHLSLPPGDPMKPLDRVEREIVRRFMEGESVWMLTRDKLPDGSEVARGEIEWMIRRALKARRRAK